MTQPAKATTTMTPRPKEGLLEGYGGTSKLTDPAKIKLAMNTREALDWVDGEQIDADKAVHVEIAKAFLEERYGTWKSFEVHEARMKRQLDDVKREKKREFWNQVIIAILAGLIIWGVTSAAPLVSIYVTNVFPNWKLPESPTQTASGSRNQAPQAAPPQAKASTASAQKPAQAAHAQHNNKKAPQKAAQAVSSSNKSPSGTSQPPTPQAAQANEATPSRVGPRPLRQALRRRLQQQQTIEGAPSLAPRRRLRALGNTAE